MTIVYTTMAYDLDGNTTNDTLSFTLVITPAGDTNDVNLTGTNARFGADGVANGNIQSGEGLTFTVSNITTTAFGGAFSASYDFTA